MVGKAHDTIYSNNIKEYYNANTIFSNKLFDIFLNSTAKIFITLSSVKAVADHSDYPLTEDQIPHPQTHYGKSKLLAEDYILKKKLPNGKRVFILRPCMIHGPGNKGNLNLLYSIIRKGIPWPLGAYENKRSFCSIENLFFVIKELIENENIESGVYNVADDEPLSTNEIIKLISLSLSKNPKIIKIPKFIMRFTAKFGDVLRLPLNSERLSKLTEVFVVSNFKLKKAINKPLPVSSRIGLLKTLNSFNN